MRKNSKSVIFYYLKRVIICLVIISLASACNLITKNFQKTNDIQGQILLWSEFPLGLTGDQTHKHQEEFKDIINQFRVLHPHTQVLTKVFPPGHILDSFLRQVKRGAGPDILLVYDNHPIIDLINQGALRSLDEAQLDLSEFRSDAIKQVRYQGQLYGLPLTLSTQVLCYNKDKVQTLPKTLSDLIEQARRGYSVGLESGFIETLWGVGVFGGQVFNEGDEFVLHQEQAWVKWMTWLQEAQHEPNFIVSDNVQALQQAFTSGRLSYLTCPDDWIHYFNEALGPDKLGVTDLPGTVDQPATPVMWARLLLFSQASSSNQTHLALKLAQFLTNQEQQQQAEAIIPFIPSNKNVTLNRDLFPIRAALFDQSQTAIAISLDNAQRMDMLRLYGDKLYRKVLAGEITPDEAAIQLAVVINRQLGWR